MPPAGYPAFHQYLQSGRVSNFAACQCDTATGSKKKGGQFGCGERLGFGLTLNRFCPTMPADPGGPIPALSSPLSSPPGA